VACWLITVLPEETYVTRKDKNLMTAFFRCLCLCLLNLTKQFQARLTNVIAMSRHEMPNWKHHFFCLIIIINAAFSHKAEDE